MAAIEGSVRVGGFIAPSDTQDTYPTHDAIYGKGGLRSAATTDARDAITAARRSEGMMVYVEADEKVYILKGGVTNNDWVDLSTQGADGADGNTLLNGTVAPTDSDGVEGDFWLETTNTRLYGPKGATSWPATYVGLIGADGQNGADGLPGAAGDSAYDIWLGNGNTGTESEFLASLVGADGADGQPGADGDSAYDIWINAGNSGTEADFLASLEGADGATGPTGPTGPAGDDGNTILNGTSDPDSSIGVAGDFYINTSTNYLFGPRAATTWPGNPVSLTGPSLFRSFASISGDAPNRDSFTDNRVEGFLAYIESANELYIYTSTSSADLDWTDTSNWQLLPLSYDEYLEVSSQTLLDSSPGDYLFSLYDTVNTTFKKFDIDSFFGYIASQLVQTMIDNGAVTEDEITFGAGNIIGDLTGDGSVGTNDLLLLLAYYGNTAASGDVSVASNIMFSNMSGGSFHTDDGYVNGTNAWATIPMNAGGFSNNNNGFATSIVDASDYVTFSDGPIVTLGGTYRVSSNSTFILGARGSETGLNAEIYDPLVFRVVNTSWDAVSIRAKIEIIDSSVTHAPTYITLLSNQILDPPGIYDLTADQQSIFGQISSYLATTTTSIRISFEATAQAGNCTSISVFDGGIRISNF